MKKLTILFLFIFSFNNAQITEKINLPDFYNVNLGRMVCTDAIKDISKGVKSLGVDVSLLEADEKSILYKVYFLVSEKSRVTYNLRVYFFDTHILINSFSYTNEIQKLVKGEKVFVKEEINEESKLKMNEIIDNLVKDVFVKNIKTQIWQ